MDHNREPDAVHQSIQSEEKMQQGVPKQGEPFAEPGFHTKEDIRENILAEKNSSAEKSVPAGGRVSSYAEHNPVHAPIPEIGRAHV